MESEASDDDKPILYSETVETPHGEGLHYWNSTSRQLTNGFQPGTVATIAGFTGHDKPKRLYPLYSVMQRKVRSVFTFLLRCRKSKCG